jgi:hypothetical protein
MRQANQGVYAYGSIKNVGTNILGVQEVVTDPFGHQFKSTYTVPASTVQGLNVENIGSQGVAGYSPPAIAYQVYAFQGATGTTTYQGVMTTFP